MISSIWFLKTDDNDRGGEVDLNWAEICEGAMT
jgi:hypothetical protein